MWLLVGGALLGAVVVFVAKALLAGKKHPKSSKEKFGVDLPRLGQDSVGCSLHFEGIGGKPAGPAGEESLALLEDFAPFTACARVEDPRSVLVDNPQLTVYSLFEDGKGVVLVEPAPESETKDLSFPRTFHYQTLRGTAHKRVLLLSFSAFRDAVAALKAAKECASKPAEAALLQRVAFVHSTGRCGSTLLSKALGSAYDIRSIAEPDIYSSVFLALKEGRIGGEEAQQVLRDATFLLAARANTSASSALAIKFRSWVALNFGVVYRAVPEAKTMFLYRHPIPTIDSFCMAFFNNAVMRLVRACGLDTTIIRSTWLGEFLPKIAPVMHTPPVTEGEVMRLGLVGTTAAAWMSVMEAALAMQNKGILDVVLRYEDLVEHKEAAITAVVDHLFPDLVTEENRLYAGALARVFGEDAHGAASTTTSSRANIQDLTHNPLYIRRADQAPLLDLLRKTRIPDTALFVLPGTLSIFPVLKHGPTTKDSEAKKGK